MPHRYAIMTSVIALIVFAGPTDGVYAQTLSNRETPLVKAIRRVRPSVVNIHSQKLVPTSGASFTNAAASPSRMNGMGTAIVIDERGYLVTNHHVVENVTAIRATLVDGATYSARIIDRDPDTDLALLKIDPLTPLQPIPVGTSEDLMHAETVIAIGNAYGYEHTITRGIISELHRNVRLSEEQSYRNLIQTDASINPGNSGGPLINADGELIGVNVAIRAGAQGIGFAIPAKQMKRVLAKLLSIRRRNGTWHGMDCADQTGRPTAPGSVTVKHVEQSSPAQQAGIRAGDRLVSVDGEPLRFAYDLELALLEKKAGERVAVELLRGGSMRTVSLRIGTATTRDLSAETIVWRRLGIHISPRTLVDQVRRVSSLLEGGVRVTEVNPGSPAEKAGVAVGDILVGLHDWQMLSIDNIKYVLDRQAQGRPELNPLSFYLIRAGHIHRGWINLPIEE